MVQASPCKGFLFRRSTAARRSHLAMNPCPGETHSTAHHPLCKITFAHGTLLLSACSLLMLALYTYYPTMSIGKYFFPVTPERQITKSRRGGGARPARHQTAHVLQTGESKPDPTAVGAANNNSTFLILRRMWGIIGKKGSGQIDRKRTLQSAGNAGPAFADRLNKGDKP